MQIKDLNSVRFHSYNDSTLPQIMYSVQNLTSKQKQLDNLTKTIQILINTAKFNRPNLRVGIAAQVDNYLTYVSLYVVNIEEVRVGELIMSHSLNPLLINDRVISSEVYNSVGLRMCTTNNLNYNFHNNIR